MSKKLKDIFISILIGACVAFFSSLFEGLAEFFKQNAAELVAGGVSSLSYILKTLRV